MPALKKRYSLSEKIITHIFEGEINSDGGLSGMHSEAVKSIENGKLRLSGGWPAGQLLRRTNGKSYWAKVSVEIDGSWIGPKNSTFFPKPGAGVPWDKGTAVRMIEQSLTNPTDCTRSSREEWTSKPRTARKEGTGAPLTKMRVGGLACNVQHQRDVGIATIYPVVPGFPA